VPPAPRHWLDRLVVAFELAANGVLTLVDGAIPARLRDAYLRLRARNPTTEVLLDAPRLAALAPGATAILVLGPATAVDGLDWLNLNRPILSERRLSVVLWCAPGTTAVLARRAPDLFDWISAQVECPPAPAPHALADVTAAIRARAHGVVWHGSGLEATLAAIRPGRPVRRVAVASYQSMREALTSSDPGWLVLEGITTAFLVRRLRWAMAETERRVIVFRQIGPDLDPSAPGWWIAPGWWSVSAALLSPTAAVAELATAGCPRDAAGRLAALIGLDPDACMYAQFAVRRGIATERLEALLAAARDPRAALHALAQQSGWAAVRVISEHDPERSLVDIRQAVDGEAARHVRDDDPIVAALRGQPDALEPWAEIGSEALQAGDFEVAIRWFSAALQRIPNDGHDDRALIATLLVQRGRAQRLAGDLPRAREGLELAYRTAQGTRDAALIAMSTGELAYALLDLGEPQRAREHLESALSASRELGNSLEVANLLDTLARALAALGDRHGAVQRLDRAYAMKTRLLATENHPAVAVSLSLRGIARAADDVMGARRDLQRSLEILDHSKQQTGIENPSVGAILSALARIERDAGDLRNARACLDRALAIQRTTLGADHPDVADTLVTLAGVLTDGGDMDGAVAALGDALAIQHKAFGNDGLAGARTRQELAKVLVARGDVTGAIDQLRRAVATRRKIHERDDPPELASMLRELDRLQELQRRLQRTD
jgi:tetratricopeptide (TPR) repeat protein